LTICRETHSEERELLSIVTLILFLVGLAFLVAGAEALVRGAARLASAMGISPLVIGLTVVAFGTSSPELAVSVQAGLSGQVDISLGNVLGSNIFNVLFILGLSAAIAPLIVSQQLVRLDVPIMIGTAVLVLLLGIDGTISRLDGAVFVLGGFTYRVLLIYLSRKTSNALEEKHAENFGKSKTKSHLQVITNVGFIIGGLALLVLGSRWLVHGAVAIAKAIGIGELIIGLTIVAAGTSLPEVATSVIASIRGERDIAVGNVVGSNIFNILVVLGLSSLFAPDGIKVSTAVIRFDIPVMVAVSIACLPIFFTDSIIARWEGILFLGYYIAYTLYLMLASTHHRTLPLFSTVMVLFVIPITLLTLIVVTWRAIRAKYSRAAGNGSVVK
jgi:cation:H+ antiporter